MGVGEIAVGVSLVVIVLPFLFGALRESGRLKAPKFGKSKTFRKFPTFPVQDEGDE